MADIYVPASWALTMFIIIITLVILLLLERSNHSATKQRMEQLLIENINLRHKLKLPKFIEMSISHIPTRSSNGSM